MIVLLTLSSLYEYIVIILFQKVITNWFRIYSLLEFLAADYLFKSLITQRPKWFYPTGLGLCVLTYTFFFIYLDYQNGISGKKHQ